MNRCVRALCLMPAIGIVGLTLMAKGSTTMANDGNSTPLCVGRMVADLQLHAAPETSATFQYIDTESPVVTNGFGALKARLEASAARYKERKYVVTDYDRKFAKAADWDADTVYGDSQLAGFDTFESDHEIVLGYHTAPGAPAINVNLYKVINGHEYILSEHDVNGDKYEAAKSSLLTAATKFTAVRLGEVPTTPGFCVAGGMFADPGHAPLHESFTLVAKFKDHPDARFVIDANAINSPDTDEPSLKHRVDSELGILRANVDGHVSVLVRGDREAAGQNGYQIGLSVPNDAVPNTTAYKFFWSADGTPKDATRPALEISLTIQPESNRPASFADAKQVEALWDELLGGLRIRPGSVAR